VRSRLRIASEHSVRCGLTPCVEVLHPEFAGQRQQCRFSPRARRRPSIPPPFFPLGASIIFQARCLLLKLLVWYCPVRMICLSSRRHPGYIPSPCRPPSLNIHCASSSALRAVSNRPLIDAAPKVQRFDQHPRRGRQRGTPRSLQEAPSTLSLSFLSRHHFSSFTPSGERVPAPTTGPFRILPDKVSSPIVRQRPTAALMLCVEHDPCRISAELGHSNRLLRLFPTGLAVPRHPEYGLLRMLSPYRPRNALCVSPIDRSRTG